MLHKVEALNTYSVLNVRDAEFNKVLPEGFQFEVDDARLKTLLGENAYNQPFVKLVDEKIEEEKVDEKVVEEQHAEKKTKKSNKKKVNK